MEERKVEGIQREREKGAKAAPKTVTFESFSGRVLERKRNRARVFLANGSMNVTITSCPTEIADHLDKGGRVEMTLRPVE